MEGQRGAAHIGYSLYMLALGRYRLTRHYRWLAWWRRTTGDERRRARDALFVDLVRCAARYVPMYRARYRSIGLDLQRLRGIADLEHLPILTPTELRQWPLHLRHAPRGIRPLLLPASTSGSGGTPLQLYRSVDEVLFYGAELLGYLEQWGIPASAPLFFILFNADPTIAFDLRPSSTIAFLRRANSVDTLLPIERISARFDHQHPALVITHPSTAEDIADYRIATGRIYTDPILFALGGEILTEGLSRKLRTAFPRRRLANIYNTVEAGLIARQTTPSIEPNQPLQVNSAGVIVEHRPHQPPVITNLRNRATPFIRYSGIEDILVAERTPKRGPEWCDAEIDRIVAIEGRRSERIYSPDRRPMSVCNLMSAHADLPGVLRFQYAQSQPDALEMRYLAAAGADHSAIADTATHIVTKLLGRHLHFSVRAVAQLQRTAGGQKIPPLVR